MQKLQGERKLSKIDELIGVGVFYHIHDLEGLANDLHSFIAEIRKTFAEYNASEGCSCCRDSESHTKASIKLAELLDAESYADGSGINWNKYLIKEQENGN
jgi:hypothetical protein